MDSWSCKAKVVFARAKEGVDVVECGPVGGEDAKLEYLRLYV